MKRNKVGLACLYILLSAWALTTIYPLFWVLENSFKAKDKILAKSFALPVGDLFTLANYKRAFDRIRDGDDSVKFTKTSRFFSKIRKDSLCKCPRIDIQINMDPSNSL